MRASVSAGRRPAFQFVLDELLPLRPAVGRLFGSTYVYLAERLLVALRESARQPRFNGVWLYTEAAHVESRRGEFPQLPRRCSWKSGPNGRVILSSGVEDFEEQAFRACALILAGDRRIGRPTRRGSHRAGGRRA